MGIPAKLLGEDEDVVLHVHTHWKALVRPVLVLLVTSAAAAYVAAAVPPGTIQPWLRIAALVLWTIIVVRWAVWPFLNWLSSTYTLTTHRIIIRTGVISRYGRDMPLSRINDVHFEHGILDRMLRCGTLVVESAGERGQLVLKDVPRVEAVQLEIYRLHEEDDERRRGLHDDGEHDGGEHDGGEHDGHWQRHGYGDDDDRRGGPVGAADPGW
jgi:uncharacterized membrane protein YdbT with pleckstrin-like domain